MNEPVILYPAIFVFSMLLIGLLLTIWEFTRMQKKIRQKQERQRAEDVKPTVVNADARKVSNF